ncbi:MAG: glyoxylate/hydroxypyruvate reductase A [Rhodospirillales bacterium]
MSVVISVKTPEWMAPQAILADLAPRLPEAQLHLAEENSDPAAVEMLVVDGLGKGEAAAYPNLRLIQKLGAGVESILRQADLPPQVRVARLRPDAPAREMTEYALAYVLREQLNLTYFAAEQRAGRWSKREPRQAPDTTVGVLGLGHIGGRVARTFAALDYRVLGYSRRPKQETGVTCLSGAEGLSELLGRSDYVVAVLPSTTETRDLMDAAAFATMKPGAVLINVGRGDLIVEGDLLASLDAGHLGGAVLDVLRREPLPADHPFWQHPKVTITPHVSGWHLDDALGAVAENYLRLRDGRPLLNEVDRRAGY